MDFIRDLWGFLKTRKKFWLLPIIIVLLVFGVLIVFTSGSAIAPFIYTLF
jgi:competence protein ComGC